MTIIGLLVKPLTLFAGYKEYRRRCQGAAPGEGERAVDSCLSRNSAMGDSTTLAPTFPDTPGNTACPTLHSDGVATGLRRRFRKLNFALPNARPRCVLGLRRGGRFAGGTFAPRTPLPPSPRPISFPQAVASRVRPSVLVRPCRGSMMLADRRGDRTRGRVGFC